MNLLPDLLLTTWCGICLRPIARGEPQKVVDLGLNMLAASCAICFSQQNPPRIESTASAIRHRIRGMVGRQAPRGRGA